MSLKIEIHVDRDEVAAGKASQYLADALSAIGFSRGAHAAQDEFLRGPNAAPLAAGGPITGGFSALASAAAPTEAPEPASATTEVPRRERGKPSPGRQRRTKEEIAEDEAAERAEAGRAEAGPLPQISTGEERVGPEDDPETAAQDAADEAAEVEAARDPSAPLTLDDLRKVVGEFGQKFGLPESVKAIPEILGCKVVDVPDTQEALAAAIEKVRHAIATRSAGTAAPAKSVTPVITKSTKAAAVAAMKQYALRYDGQNEDLRPAAIPVTEADASAILKRLFGETVTKIPHVPDTPENWARVETAVLDALENNPFGREVKG